MSYSERYFAINRSGGIQYYGGVGNPAPVRTRSVSAPSGGVGSGGYSYGYNLASQGGAGGYALASYGGSNTMSGGVGGSGAYNVGGAAFVVGGGGYNTGGYVGIYGGGATDPVFGRGGNVIIQPGYGPQSYGFIDIETRGHLFIGGLPSGSVGLGSNAIYRDSMDGVTLKAVP